MADLLARLAERTLRTVPTSQPVLTSRFDPGQVMTPPILETEAWNTAGAAPVQDTATTRPPETGEITLTQGRQELDVAAHDAATAAPPKTGNRAGGQEVANHLDTNRAGMMQTEIATVAPGYASPGLVETGSIQSGQPDINLVETGSVLSGQPDTHVIELMQMEAGVPAARTAATNPVVTKSATGSTLVAGRAGLSVPLNEKHPFVEDSHAREVEMSLPLPEAYKPEVELSLPASEFEVMNTLSGEQDSTRRAFAPGLLMRQGEPATLEQEENVPFQLVVQRNSIAPPVEKGHITAPFEQAISLQPEETSLPGTSSDMREEYTVEAELVPTSPDNSYISRTGVQKSSPTHAGSSTPSGIVEQVDGTSLPLESDEGAKRMASSKGLLSRQQEGTDPTPTTDDLKGPLSHPQSPSPLHAVAQKETLLLEESVEEAQHGSPGNTAAGEHAIGPNAKPGYYVSTDKKDEFVTVEQHLLLPQAQLQQGIVPQELADESYNSAFTSGPVRNYSRSAMVQHDPAELQPASATAAPPTPPSIHITIGRIDVRAVISPGPTRPSKPARPSPLLSLDDYLKQGKGGRQ